MATAELIAELRGLVNELADAEPYTDEALSTRLDAALGSVQAVASEIWYEKAARYADLVDVQEGSSRRSLSKLYEQALEMGKHFASDDGSGSGGTSRRYSRTRAIERP